jgi:hypothetical protein
MTQEPGYRRGEHGVGHSGVAGRTGEGVLAVVVRDDADAAAYH